MDTKKIGSFIACRRREKGLTQEQLGEKLGVTNKTVSRWENGNYMPDLSLLEPLSKELGITLNELLAGETLEESAIAENAEKNLIGTIDYSARKIRNTHRGISLMLMASGIFLSFCALTIFEAESSWSSFYSILGILLFVIGLFRELKTKALWKRLIASFAAFILILSGFAFIDYIGVTVSDRPPVYRYMTETGSIGSSKIILYHNPFYTVYRINTDTKNEYYIVDREKKYTEETVPLSPFNRKKSGIDSIINYENDFIGNSSNAGGLISSLPLSEYGYVFEIKSDGQKNGLVIDYHMTDWYDNDDLYVEKSLLYNSVSIFALIKNADYIQYNFSGSAYKVTRAAIEKHYPKYETIVKNSKINKDAFNQYVERKMNDYDFVESVFPVIKSL